MITPEVFCEALSALSIATASLGGGFFVTRLCMYLRAHGTPVQIIGDTSKVTVTAHQPESVHAFEVTMEPSLNGAR